MEDNLKRYLAFLRTRHSAWLYKDELGGEWICDKNPKGKDEAVIIPLPDGFIELFSGLKLDCDDDPLQITAGYVQKKLRNKQ